MRARKPLALTVFVAVLMALGSHAGAEEELTVDSIRSDAPDRPWEVIDVAIALDTSGSMELLIEAARLKLWEIVQDLTAVEPAPRLRVALLTFGNTANPRETGWVRVEADFTQDLDLVSERLFDLTSKGGVEYIGRVLETAFESLSWTPSDEALKLLFVAGNEAADQDPLVPTEEMTNVAREAGISLHVIFCGQEESEDAESWKLLAEVASGQFATIDHRSSPVAVETPFDAELAALSSAMNETYIPLGEEGMERQKQLIEQDGRVLELSPAAAASRAAVKSSRFYSSEWDLVDAFETGEVDFSELDEDQLPQEMQAMSLDEREIHVQDMQAARRELRQRIAELSDQRRRYVAREMKVKKIDTSRAFDTVVRQAIQEELEARGFRRAGGSG